MGNVCVILVLINQKFHCNEGVLKLEVMISVGITRRLKEDSHFFLKKNAFGTIVKLRLLNTVLLS